MGRSGIVTLNSAQESIFSRWWYAYPRKVAKLEAIKAFSQVWAAYGPFDEDWLKTALEALVWQFEDTEPLYIPYPATYLRAGRWMDEREVKTPPKQREREHGKSQEQIFIDKCHEMERRYPNLTRPQIAERVQREMDKPEPLGDVLRRMNTP